MSPGRYTVVLNRKISKRKRKQINKLGKVVEVPRGKDIVDLLYEIEHEDLIAAGGDGTVNKVAKYCYETDSKLGILPLGTGNDLHSSYRGLPFEKQIDALLHNPITIEKYDLIQLDTGDISVVGVDFGVIGALTNVSDGVKRIFGKLAYTVSGVYYVLKPKKEVTIEIDGEKIHEGKFTAMHIFNVPTAGGKQLYLKGVNPIDGKLDAVLIGDIPRYRTIATIPKLKNANEVEQVEKYRQFETFNTSETHISFDGERPYKQAISGWVMPNALKLIIPEDSKRIEKETKTSKTVSYAPWILFQKKSGRYTTIGNI